MYCSMCGHENREGARFCSRCGAPLKGPVGDGSRVDGGGPQVDDRVDPESAGSAGIGDASTAGAGTVGTASAGLASGEGTGPGGPGGAGDAGAAGVGEPHPGWTAGDACPARVAPTHRPPRRRGPVIALVAVAVAVLVAAGVGLWTCSRGGGGSDVVAYSSKEAVALTPTATVVLRGDDGDPLEDYDLRVVDEEGAATVWHVDEASFTLDALDLSEGRYTFIVVDPDGDRAHSALIEVTEDEGARDQAEFEPSGDGGDAVEEDGTTARQSAYSLFLAYVRGLQAQYGEAEMVDWTDGMSALTGTAAVQLVDFEDDGVEELVVAYCDGDLPDASSDPAYQIEVWRYEGGSIECAYEGEPYSGNGSIFLYRGSGATPVMYDMHAYGVTDEGFYTQGASYIGCPASGDELEVERFTIESDGTEGEAATWVRFCVDGEDVGDEAYHEEIDRWVGQATGRTEMDASRLVGFTSDAQAYRIGQGNGPDEVLDATEYWISVLEGAAQADEPASDGSATDAGDPSVDSAVDPARDGRTSETAFRVGDSIEVVGTLTGVTVTDPTSAWDGDILAVIFQSPYVAADPDSARAFDQLLNIALVDEDGDEPLRPDDYPGMQGASVRVTGTLDVDGSGYYELRVSSLEAI